MDKKEKLQKIQQVLEESLGLKWRDRIIYNINTKRYHTADICDFCSNKLTYVYLMDDKKIAHLARVKIDDEKFIIKVNGMTIDVSSFWQEVMQETTVKV